MSQNKVWKIKPAGEVTVSPKIYRQFSGQADFFRPYFTLQGRFFGDEWARNGTRLLRWGNEQEAVTLPTTLISTKVTYSSEKQHDQPKWLWEGGGGGDLNKKCRLA